MTLKGFDKVQHQTHMEILKRTNLDDKYAKQKATVRLGQDMFQEFSVKRGERQRVILFPLLFNVDSEKLAFLNKHYVILKMEFQ